MSIAVLEALAAGTPVVSTPVSGMRELDGVAVAGFDPRELAETVRELLQDPAQRTIMGDAGAKLVRQRFSADAMVESYVRAYTSLTPTIHD
jgi:glycosyltransferase involved in cell wall biosynthesis